MAKVRIANEGDATPISRLAQQLGYATSPGEAADRIGEMATRVDQTVFVAVEKGEVIGWIHVFEALRVEADRFAELGGLVVDAAHRGKGIGRKLMSAAEGWAVGRQCDTIRIRSNVLREGSHEFYEHLGYARSKKQAVYARKLPASEAAAGGGEPE